MRRFASVFTHISFDLDNTLYDYDRNSRTASGAVMELINAETGAPVESIQRAYSAFLRRIPGPRLFSDGRTSYEYRKERFTEILKMFSNSSDELVKRCIETYSTTILAEMAPYPDTVEVLEKLKKMDKTIVIITDAPQDIQQTILEVLGIHNLIDHLFTPTTEGNIKEDGGLFFQALDELEVGAGSVLHIGDSHPRDVLGARAAGIRAVLLDRPGSSETQAKDFEMQNVGADVDIITSLDGLFEFI